MTNETQPEEQLKRALELDIPHIYVTGFVNAGTNADVLVLLKQNNRDMAILNLSYSAAKTLCQKLTELVDAFEGKTSSKIMTLDEIAQCFTKDAKSEIDS